MVKGLVPRLCTPAALVTSWSVMTPEIGAVISTMPVGWSTSLPSRRRCSAATSTAIFALLLGVLCHLQIVQRVRAFCVEKLHALQLRLGQHLVGHVRLIVRKGAGDIVAAQAQQQLALLHRIAQAREDAHNTTGGQRDDRDRAVNIGIHRAGYGKLRGRSMLHGRGQWVLVRAVDGELLRLVGRGDLGRRRRTGRGIASLPACRLLPPSVWRCQEPRG